MTLRTFNFLLFLQLMTVIITQISSRELLKALYESDEPLLLNEEKSRQIAEDMEKRKQPPSKVGSGKGQQQFFSQLDDYLDVQTDEFDDTKSQVTDYQRYRDNTKVTPRPDQTNVEPQAQDSAIFKFQADDSDCPENLPTYRVYMGTKCIPIIPEIEENLSGQEEEKPNQKPDEPKESSSSYNQHLINYLDFNNPYYVDHYGQQHEGHSQSGKYEQKSGYNPQQSTHLEKESEIVDYRDDWDKYGQNHEGQTSYWDRYQQLLNNEQNQHKETENQQQIQQNIFDDQQEYGQYGEQRNSKDYQESIYGQSQNSQSHLSSDYADDPNSFDSYWSQNSGSQVVINPGSSSNSKKPQQNIPMSVNTERLSSSKGQNQIDAQEQYSQQFYPPHTIGHRPHPIQIPVDNSAHQQQRPTIVLGNTIQQQHIQKPVSSQNKNEKIICNGKKAGFYPDYASDCRKFYQCAFGDYRTFEFSCGSGTKFHPIMHVCVHEKDVDCRENNKLPIMK